MSGLGEIVHADKVGERDAVHVPVVVVKCYEEVKPGDFVRFIDSDCEEVEVVSRDFADAMVDPFLTNVQLDFCNVFRVLVLPGKTSPVRHVFDINGHALKHERNAKMARGLEELQRIRDEDDGCAACWDIDEEGNVFRW